MADESATQPATLALNTKIEAEFVAPLAAIRGALEILRDHGDLTPEEQRTFVETALSSCARIERGVEDLASALYAQEAGEARGPSAAPAATVERVAFLEGDVVEIDLSEMRFANSREVDRFFDSVERALGASGRKWWLLVDYRDCSIWPEAWIAFAHRAKRVTTQHALGAVRYEDLSRVADPNHSARRAHAADPDFFGSREAALARLRELRAATRGP